MPERKSPKRTISTSSELGLLQIVLEQDTGRCANEEAEPQREWTRGGVPARKLAPKGVDWGVPHRLEKGTSARKGKVKEDDIC